MVITHQIKSHKINFGKNFVFVQSMKRGTLIFDFTFKKNSNSCSTIMTGKQDVTKTKGKQLLQKFTHLMCSLVLLLTISLQLAASFRHSKYLSSLLVFCLPSHRNHVKESSGNFKNPKKVGLTVLEKISKWQHKLIRDYKPIKLISYFLNNVVKTRLYGLKISENIEFEHIF